MYDQVYSEGHLLRKIGDPPSPTQNVKISKGHAANLRDAFDLNEMLTGKVRIIKKIKTRTSQDMKLFL